MIHLTLSCNENYADGLLVTIASALTSLNQNAQITIHFMNGGVSDHTLSSISSIINSTHKNAKLNIINVNDGMFRGFEIGPGNSMMTYVRLLMGSLFEGIDKVIYIDVDFLVLKDLEELWNRDMQGKIAWACRDIEILSLDGETPLPVSDHEKLHPYFNAGLLLVDLKKWRDANIEEKSLDLGLINKSTLADQSILNYLFRGDVGFLEQNWNWQSRNVLAEGKARIANYHFIWVKKPWMYYGTTLNYRLWRYYYKHFAFGSLWRIYSQIGLKGLMIGFREILIRSNSALLKIYLKVVAMKSGSDSPRYHGIKKYYLEDSTAFPMEQEKLAYSSYVNLHKSF